MTLTPFVPHVHYQPEGSPETLSKSFYEMLAKRRSIRYFSEKAVSRETIENVIHAAGTAPSGANKQPWRFVAITDPEIKREIRLGAEEEEREFYSRRASDTWLEDLRPLGTDDEKPFLEIAPWLIVVFKLMKDDNPETKSDQIYYANESVGIACGMLLAAAHASGLATLTHTPSPMKFLGKILNRPEYERPYLLVPMGYPADGCTVPDIHRKPLDQIMVVNRNVLNETRP